MLLGSDGLPIKKDELITQHKQNPEETIQKLLATELLPNVRECENELVSIRDELFGDLIKGVTNWEFPAISIAYFANLGFAGAVPAFATAVGAAVPHVVDT